MVRGPQGIATQWVQAAGGPKYSTALHQRARSLWEVEGDLHVLGAHDGCIPIVVVVDHGVALRQPLQVGILFLMVRGIRRGGRQH